MNERILELAIQAREYAETKPNIYQVAYDKKFAELIVQECIALMNDEKEYFSNPGPYQSSDYYERCRAKEDAFDDAARIIASHFGVE